MNFSQSTYEKGKWKNFSSTNNALKMFSLRKQNCCFLVINVVLLCNLIFFPTKKTFLLRNNSQVNNF